MEKEVLIKQIVELTSKLINEKLTTCVYESGYYQTSAYIDGKEEMLEELKTELSKLNFDGKI